PKASALSCPIAARKTAVTSTQSGTSLPNGGFGLLLLYQKLNQIESRLGNDVWGGSHTRGGISPEARRLSSSPEDLAEQIERSWQDLTILASRRWPLPVIHGTWAETGQRVG